MGCAPLHSKEQYEHTANGGVFSAGQLDDFTHVYPH